MLHLYAMEVLVALMFLQCLLMVTGLPKAPPRPHQAASPQYYHVELPQDLCTSPIYCNGELLKRVQLGWLFNDSKTFVDMRQKQDPEQTIDKFNQLLKATNNNPSRSELYSFVNESFDEVNELVNATLDDWRESVKLEGIVKDPIYKQWVSDLNKKWTSLARRMDDDVRNNPTRHSLIYVNNTFVIPGGRFKEFYYWDTYWIIEGLLICEMRDTARGIIDNFMSVVERYGFIPNGGRVYYLMRSQPPFLIPMVEKYLEFTGDFEYVKKHLSTMEKEFEYFRRFKTIRFKMFNKYEFEMYHYVTNSDGPRPESYREDYNLSLKLADEQARRRFFNNIKAGAESGWDFSARWFVTKDGNFSWDPSDISTEDIIPVDLNSFVEKNARTLAGWFARINNYSRSYYYANISSNLQEAIEAVLWNQDYGMWFDYNVKFQKHKLDFYPSNLAPLYTRSYHPARATLYGRKAVEYLKTDDIAGFQGGIPASLNFSRQQWDFPNAWAPLQSIVVEGLRQTRYPPAQRLAKKLAQTWLRSNYIAFNNSNLMYEKYDATQAGREGGGGEYEIQDGFGWTNGVVLEFLSAYPEIRFSDTKNPNQAVNPQTTSDFVKKVNMYYNIDLPIVPVLKSTWSHYFGDKAIDEGVIGDVKIRTNATLS